jgi:hypothetical protein
MMAPTYQSLTEKWKKQADQFFDWRKQLAQEAHGLRNDVASVLGGPEKWTTFHDHEERRYVEIIDLSVAERPPAGFVFKDAISDKGELIFGISFTFDRASNSYPKSQYYIALAVRFRDSVPEFCQWDSKANQPMAGSSWERDKQKLIERLLAVLERHISFDPFQGIPERSGIGFIPTP